MKRLFLSVDNFSKIDPTVDLCVVTLDGVTFSEIERLSEVAKQNNISIKKHICSGLYWTSKKVTKLGFLGLDDIVDVCDSVSRITKPANCSGDVEITCTGEVRFLTTTYCGTNECFQLLTLYIPLAKLVKQTNYITNDLGLMTN